jgi:hypothetical protein
VAAADAFEMEREDPVLGRTLTQLPDCVDFAATPTVWA